MSDPAQSPDAAVGQRPLVANTAYAVVGHGCYHACHLGAIILLAKFGSPEILGEYFLALAIATPVVLLFGFELRGAFVADAGNQFTFGTYDALRRRLLLPAALVLGVVLLAKALTESHWAYVVIFLGVFAQRLLWSVSEVGWGTFQRRERLDLLGLAAGLRGVAFLLPFALLLPFLLDEATPPARRAQVAALALLLAVAGVGLVLWRFDWLRVRNPQLWDLCFTGAGLRALAWQTLPLGVVALVINLCDTFPRWMFEAAPDGATQLGYFGSLAYITLAGNLVIIQAANAAANRLAAYYRTDLPRFLRLGAGLLLLAGATGGVVLVVALWAGAWILRILYTPDYAQYEPEFQLIVLAHALALLTNVFGVTTTQMRLFWVQVPVQVVTLVVTVVAAVMLIPDAPVRGAAWTALIRSAVQLALYALCVFGGIVSRPGRIADAAEHGARPPNDGA
jgi:O-antigen/teichoic acid export membrane protein